MSLWQDKNNDYINRLRGWIFIEGVMIVVLIILIIRK